MTDQSCSIPCDGSCCEIFAIPNLDNKIVNGHKKRVSEYSGDQKKVIDMLIPLSYVDALEKHPEYFKEVVVPETYHSRGLRFKKEEMLGKYGSYEEFAKNTDEVFPESRVAYTCKHLTNCGKCSIYNDRPEMCKKFPNMHTCPHCGNINEKYHPEKRRA